MRYSVILITTVQMLRIFLILQIQIQRLRYWRETEMTINLNWQEVFMQILKLWMAYILEHLCLGIIKILLMTDGRVWSLIEMVLLQQAIVCLMRIEYTWLQKIILLTTKLLEHTIFLPLQVYLLKNGISKEIVC